jgi:hypothetical protein
MANCTNIGTVGPNVSLAVNPLPPGVRCVLTGFAQSAAGQTARVLSGATVLAQITTTGGGPVRMMLPPTGATNTFVTPPAAAGITIEITNTTGQKSQIITSFETVTWGTRVYAGQWTFAVDDSPNGGDCDFNDALVMLTWTASQG